MKIPRRYKSLGKKFYGGMGDVHIYQDQNLHREVAIKIVQDRELAARLLDEVRAFKRVSSKHVVEIYDIMRDKGELAIIEEYLPGQELTSPGKGFDKDTFLHTFFQIASGLDEIHASGLIHRDIKPGNMKFDDEGIIKIFDFGLAREFGVDATTRGFRGTPGFAAPELYQYDTVAFTPAIDVYAFGVTCLYYCLGNLPGEIRGLRTRSSRLIPFSGALGEVLPKELLHLLDKTLEFFPSDRPAIREVKELFERHILNNKHKALMILDGNSHYLDHMRPSVTVSAGSKGKISIHYDGLYFKVVNFENDILVNNTPVVVGMIMPGACVVSFGSPIGKDRKHMTFDVSHPGVVL